MTVETREGMIIACDLMVIARDGVGLTTDVFHPPREAPFSVLLERTRTINQRQAARSGPRRLLSRARALRPQPTLCSMVMPSSTRIVAGAINRAAVLRNI